MNPRPDPGHESVRQPTRADLLERYLDLLRSDDGAAAEEFAAEHEAAAEEFAAVRMAWERLAPFVGREEEVGLAARLRSRFGGAVDPGITLGDRPSDDAPGTRGVSQEYHARFGRDGAQSQRYRSPREIARGGMGSIRCVWDADLRRELVMKVMLLPSDRSGGNDTRPPDGRTLSRFLEEAQITSQLDHPGILPVHDIGIDESGRLFFTMPLVKGDELGKVIQQARAKEEGWDGTRILGVLIKAMEAVAFAHSRGVVHRDIKPENIMVGRFGETYVMDWGLARVLEQAERSDDDRRATTIDAIRELRNRQPAAPALEPSIKTERSEGKETDSRVATLDGDVIGTPGYMAPEQARGQHDKIGPRADVYAFGAILYQLLTGYAPYGDPISKRADVPLMQRVLESRFTPILRLEKDVPLELVAIATMAMRTDPQLRYGSMLELLEDLRAYVEGRVVSAHDVSLRAEVLKWTRRNRLAATILAVSVAVVAVSIAIFVWQLKASLDVKNDALETATAERRNAQASADEARRARRDAERDAEAAQRERRAAELQGYAANLSAVQASIADNDLSEARRRLETCPPELRGWEYEHLSQRIDMSLLVIGGRAGALIDVAVAPDGRVVSASAGDTVTSWNVENGNAIVQFEVRDAEQVAFEPDGGSFVVACADGRVLRMSRGSAQQIELIEALPRAQRSGLASALSRDGRALALSRSTPEGCVIELVDLSDGSRVALEPPRGAVNVHAMVFDASGDSIAIASSDADGNYGVMVRSTDPNASWSIEVFVDGAVTDIEFAAGRESKYLALCTDAGQLVVWDLAADTTPLAQTSADRTLTSVCFGDRHDTIYAGTANGTIEVWEVFDANRALVLRGHDGPITDLAYDATRDQVVSTSTDGTLRTWPAAAGDVVQSFVTSHSGPRAWIDFSNRGDQIVLASPQGAEFWDAASLRHSTTLQVRGMTIGEPHLTDDGMVTGAAHLGPQLGADSRWAVQSWSAATGESLRGRGPIPGAVTASDVSSTGQLALAIESATIEAGAPPRAALVVRDLGAEADYESQGRIVPLTSPATSVTFDASGERIALAHVDGRTTIWSAETLEVIATLVPEELRLRALGVDAALVVATSAAASIGTRAPQLVNTSDQASSPDAVTCIAFQPTGEHIATGGANGVVRLWNSHSGALVRELLGHDGAITAVAFHPTQKRFVTGSEDGSLRVWNLELGECLLVLRGHDAGLRSIAFDPAGERLASIDADGEVHLFETQPQTQRYSAQRESRRGLRTALEIVGLIEGFFSTNRPAPAKPGEFTDVLDDERPVELHERAWELVRSGGRSAREYETAHSYANAASALLPANPVYRRTLGVALYRIGRFREAIDQIEASMVEHATGPRPEELAVIGMAHARLGALADANDMLQALDELLRSPLWSSDPAGQDFRRELVDLLEH